MSFIALTSLFELYLLLTKKQTVYQLFILNFYCYLIFVTVCFRIYVHIEMAHIDMKNYQCLNSKHWRV